MGGPTGSGQDPAGKIQSTVRLGTSRAQGGAALQMAGQRMQEAFLAREGACVPVWGREAVHAGRSQQRSRDHLLPSQGSWHRICSGQRARHSPHRVGSILPTVTFTFCKDQQVTSMKPVGMEVVHLSRLSSGCGLGSRATGQAVSHLQAVARGSFLHTVHCDVLM